MKKIISIVIDVLAVVLFILMLGSLINNIPIIGDFSTTFSGQLIQIWLPLIVVTLAISGYRWLKNKNRKNTAILIILIISFLMATYITTIIVTSFSGQDVKVSFFKTFTIENTSDIKIENLKYKDKSGQELPIRLYYKDNKEGKKTIIYTHGGGWIWGSEADQQYTLGVLAKKGFVCASIGYELSNAEKHLWDKTEEQILYGINYITDYLNKDEIYVIGDSAGGNLALDIAYKISDGTYSEIKERKLPIIKAVSVNYPVTDPKEFYYNNNFLAQKTSKKMTTQYLGGTPEQVPERYEKCNPKNHIGKNTPPTCIIVGENDPLVPVQSTYDFSKSLSENRIKNKLVKIPYFGHACDLHKNNLFNQAYINLTLQWFDN